MAVQTIYILATTAVTPNWFGNTQLNGSAPTSANTAYGWAPGTTAVTTPYYRGRLGSTGSNNAALASSYNASTSGPTAGLGAGITGAGDSFIAGPFTGTFAATAWTLNFNMRASTAGAKGRINVQIWKSANADGSSPTLLLSNLPCSTITLSTTADANSLLSWTPSSALTFANEYLFFQVEWQETTAGTSGTNNVFFRAGTASITTSNLSTGATQWQGTATFAGAGGLTANATIPIASGPGSTITFSNNVLHYAFDDTVTTDSSGLSNTGTLNGSGTTQVTGQIGQALSFNGSGYVAFTSVALLGLASQSSEISVSCWLKTTATDGAILSLRNGTNANTLFDFGVGFNGLNNSGTGFPSIINRSDIDSGLSGLTALNASLAVNDGTWHHVVFTRNSSKLLTIYIDGVSNVSVTDILDAGITPNLPNSTIGYETANGSVPLLVGSIDDFQIYSRALTLTEIRTLYVYGIVTAATDNFDRADGALGANWILSPGFTGGTFGIVSNQVVGTGSVWRMAYWNPATNTAANDQLASVTLVAGSFMGPVVRHQSGASSGYFVFYNGSASGALYMYRFDAGVFTLLGTTGTNASFGDTLGLKVTGSTLQAYVNDAPSGSSFTDTTYTSGQPGIAVQNATIDNFIANPFVAAATQWQGTALLAGAGSLVATIQRLSPITGAFAGAGTLTGTARQWLAGTAAFSGSSTLAVTDLVKLLGNVTFAGAGALSINEDQWYTAQSTFAGLGALTATGLVLRPISAAFNAVGSLSVSAPQQLLAATAGWSGAGALAVDVVRLVGGTAWQGNALLAGAGALTAAPAQWLTFASSFAGVGAVAASGLVIRPIAAGLSGVGGWSAGAALLLSARSTFGGVATLAATSTQWLALNSSFAGTGTLAAASLVLRPLTAGLPGVGVLSANTALLLASAAAWNGSGQLSAAITQLQSISPVAIAGTGGLSADLTQAGAVTQWPGTAILAGAGSLQVASTQWLTARSAFAGTGTLTAPTLAQVLPASAPFVGTGSFTSQVTQLLLWQATAAGTGNLAVDLQRFTPGAWQGNALFAGAGTLAAVSTQQLVAATTAFAGAGSLASPMALQLLASSALTGVGNLTVDVAFLGKGFFANADFAGAGSFSAVARINVSGVAAFGAVGTLTAYAQLTASWQARLAGSGAFSAQAQAVMALANVFAGDGALQADVDQWQLITAALAGHSSLSAQAGVWQHFAAAFVGGGSLTVDTFTRALQLISCAPIQGRRSQSGILQGALQQPPFIRGQQQQLPAEIIAQTPPPLIRGRQQPAEIIAETDFAKTQPN